MLKTNTDQTFLQAQMLNRRHTTNFMLHFLPKFDPTEIIATKFLKRTTTCPHYDIASLAYVTQDNFLAYLSILLRLIS